MLREGARQRTRLVDLYWRRSVEPLPRMGLVVPKLGYRIVDRNRIKRRVREIGRSKLLPRLRQHGPELDILIRIRRPAYRAAYSELELAILEGVEAACSDT
ncbi:MAG: ribonuclease P protein component [Gemmatimonadetes bacterium]|nr:ribonuclease P protein component [Gemmatimonadota bacterium]MYE16480.1 ribonuclease P protein component [Gemmatimonadota bacterium]